MIYISFPGDITFYPDKATYPPELIYHIYNGLKNKYGEKQVEIVPFYKDPPTNDSKDILVTQIFGSYGKVLRERVILVENSNFESNKWNKEGKARYTKYGVNSDNEIDGVYGVNECLENVGSAIFISNDVALKRWNENHPDIRMYKNYLQQTIKNIIPIPHPLEKQRYLRFFNPEYIPATPKLLIYHAGSRKNSLQYIQILRDFGFKEDKHFVITSFVNKNDHELLRRINREYHAFVNCSFSESGPINVIEFMFQGLLIIGHEEWWSGYNFPQTIWTYDPDRHDEMRAKIWWLLDPARRKEIKEMRNKIVNYNVNRKDNEWPYLINHLYTLIDNLL